MGSRAKIKWARFIEPGLISYKDKGNGIWLIEKEAIDNSANSIIGVPINLGHKSEANPQPAKIGLVADWRFDNESGCYDAKMLIEDENVLAAIEQGVLFPSCEYMTEEAATPGEINGISYDFKPLEINFVALALVEKPRYTIAKIVENSKGGEQEMLMFGKKEKTENSAAAPPEANGQNTEGAKVKAAGKILDFAELVAFFKEKNAENSEPEENLLDPALEVDIGGKKITVGEIVKFWEENHNATLENEDGEKKDIITEEKTENAISGDKTENSAPPRTVINSAPGMIREISFAAQNSGKILSHNIILKEQNDAYVKQQFSIFGGK